MNKNNSPLKNSMSFTTLNSNNFSKSYTSKFGGFHKTQIKSRYNLIKDLEDVQNRLEKQLKLLNIKKEKEEKNWYQTVEKINSQVRNNKIKNLIKTIQNGYDNLANKNN